MVRPAILKPSVLAALLIGGAAFTSAAARAEPLAQRLRVGVEFGGGTMLSSYQRSALDYDKDLQASLFGGLTVINHLDAELTLRNWWFPSGQGYGRGTLVGAGGRVWFLDDRAGAAFANGNLGLGRNGDSSRFMFDLGLGYVFHLPSALDLGPVFRYGEVVTSSADAPNDARFWSLGVTVSYRPFHNATPTQESPVAAAPPATAPAKQRVAEKVADRDGDGVDDLHDNCPDVASGPNPDPDKPGCPDGDQDKDGVADHLDQCRAVPKGFHPDPAQLGCPLPDRDQDSVPDAEDHCPDKPGAPSPEPRLNGCPGLVNVTAGKIQINRPVFFATGDERILPTSFPVLQAVADTLKMTTEIHEVEIQGHTDAQGDPERNRDLSQRRAASVRNWLVQHGIDTLRVRARGFGDSKPQSTNKTAKGRGANRRVEFLIVDPPQVSNG
jgi:outer membrane protein OmpA-like peptidoglycan-associated protein